MLTLHETVVESGAIAGVKGQAIEVHSAVTFISLASSLLHLLDEEVRDLPVNFGVQRSWVAQHTWTGTQEQSKLV